MLLVVNSFKLHLNASNLPLYVCCVCFRPHGGSDTVPTTRLSLDELQGFMQQLQNLPCVVREAELVQVSDQLFGKKEHSVKAAGNTLENFFRMFWFSNKGFIHDRCPHR